MLRRIVIVPIVVSTLCAVLALPATAQLADGYRLLRKAVRLRVAARSDEDRKQVEQTPRAAILTDQALRIEVKDYEPKQNAVLSIGLRRP